MTITHLNCGSLQPFFAPVQAITYVLLVETDTGLLLVDTGFGTFDYEAPSLLARLLLPLMGVPRDLGETASHQLVMMGLDPRDVRHIVLTHLHLDHAGGLRDFPEAAVHVHRTELQATRKRRKAIEVAYNAVQWSHGPKWILHERTTAKWFGFDAIAIDATLKPRILLVPLPGHTRGHCGVAIETEKGWLLQCGDAASPFHKEADPQRLDHSRHGLHFLPDRLTRSVIGPHVPRLRQLLLDHGDEVELISAHDIYSFRRYNTPGSI